MSTDKKKNDKVRRVAAWVGIVLVLAMYVLTFVAALMSSPAANGLFMASLTMTIMIPGAIFVFLWLRDLGKRRKDEE